MAKKKEHFPFILAPEAPFSIATAQGEVLDKSYKVWLHLARSPEYRVAYYNHLIEYLRTCVRKKKVLGVSLEHSVATLYFLAVIPYILDLEDPPLPRDSQGIAKASSLLESDLGQIMSFGLKPAEALVTELVRSIIVLPPLSYSHRDLKYCSYLSGQEVLATSIADLAGAGPYSYTFYLNPIFAEVDFGKHTFLYLYLRRLVDKNPALAPLFGHSLVGLLRALPADDATFEQKLLPLLLLIESATLRYNLPPDVLESLASEVEGFRRWPLPYSSAATLTHTLLTQEHARPGLPFMRKVKAEWRPLSVTGGGLDVETEFLLASNSSVLARLFVEWVRREFDLFMEVPRVQGRSRTSVIAHCLRIKWIASQLQGRADARVNVKIPLLGEHDALRVSERLFEQGVRIDEVAALILQADRGEDTLIDAFARSRLSTSAQWSYPPLLLKHLDPDCSSMMTPIDMSESFRVVAKDVRMANIFKHLQQVLKPSPSPVKLILCGSDELIHSFLLAYYKLVSAESSLYDSVQLQLYIVPDMGATDSLSQYLASVDPWYQRHVYMPAKRLPWSPVISAGDLAEVREKVNVGKSALHPPDLQLPPVRMASRLLRDYVQEASTKLHVALYELECIGFKSSFVFPFCMYVEVGVAAAAKREQRNNPDASLESILESKTFRFEPKPLDLRVTQVDLFGVEYAQEEVTNKQIHRLVISNVPRVSDRTTPASPVSDWLELAYIEKGAAEEEAAYLRQAKSGRQIPQELANVLSSLYSCLHVRETVITCSLPLTDFDVVVDGELYGPFTSLRISPMRSLASDDAPSLRVMAFNESDKI